MPEAAVRPAPNFSEFQIPAFYRTHDISPQVRLNYMASFLRFLTHKHNANVEYAHSPCTDGKTIWLGNVDVNDEDYEVIVLGHGIHEVMHVLETDMECVKIYPDKSFAKVLLNVLEDVRIDRLGLERFGNYMAWRSELIEVLKSRRRLRVAKNLSELSPADLLSCFLHTKLMVHAGFNWAHPYLPKLEKGIKRQLGKRSVEKIVGMAMATFGAKNTKDIVAVVDRLMAYLEAEHKSLTAYQPSLWDDPEFVDGFGTDTAAAIAANFMAAVMQGNCRGPANDLVVAQLPATAGKGKGGKTKIAECDAYWPDVTEDKLVNEDAKFYSRAFDKVFDLVDSMTDEFESLLETVTDTGIMRWETGERLCRNWIQHLMQNDRRIFVKRAPEVAVSAEICILLDRSGSMGVKTLTHAKAAVLGLISALKKIEGCQVRAACFPGPIKSHVSIVASPDETIDEISERFAKIGAYGSTPVEEALNWGKDSFDFSEDVQNRLLLVITDGRFPSVFSQRVEAELNRNGVELALLSIDVPNKNACRNSQHIEDVNELQPALLRLFSETEFCQAVRND